MWVSLGCELRLVLRLGLVLELVLGSDMIETYKIVNGKYQGCIPLSLIKEEIYVTRVDLRAAAVKST